MTDRSLLTLVWCVSACAAPVVASDAASQDEPAFSDATESDAGLSLADVVDAAPPAQDARADVAALDYPAGPYGRNAGDVIATLPWVGYVNADGTTVSSMLPWGETSLADLRARAGGRGYALVHMSEFL